MKEKEETRGGKREKDTKFLLDHLANHYGDNKTEKMFGN